MPVHRRKEKWDSMTARMEELQAEAIEQEIEAQRVRASTSTKKTPSD